MHKIFEYLLLFIGLLPLIFKMPYMLNAWRSSTIECYDWIFMVLAFAILIFLWLKIRPKFERVHTCFLLFSIASIFLYVLGFAYSIHAVSILGSMILFWSIFGVLYGQGFALQTLPFLGILCFSCTSTTYWIGFFIKCNALFFKLLFTTVFVILALIAQRFKHLSIKGITFLIISLIIVLLYVISNFSYETFPPYELTLKTFIIHPYIGREISPSASDLRFFGKSQIQRAFYTDDINAISVLKVSDFDNVHKIHPAGHCLRSSGRTVVSDQLYLVDLPDRKLQVNEVVVENQDGRKMLVWTWYTNQNNASGSFIFFRKKYDPTEKWSTWQVAITSSETDMTLIRENLKEFLILFKASINNPKIENI